MLFRKYLYNNKFLNNNLKMKQIEKIVVEINSGKNSSRKIVVYKMKNNQNYLNIKIF